MIAMSRHRRTWNISECRQTVGTQGVAVNVPGDMVCDQRLIVVLPVSDCPGTCVALN
jgi:hypothetical protein